MLLNLVDVSCWSDTDDGKAMASATPARRRDADFAAAYQLELPYPFLFEPEGRPWFQSWQILDSGVKDGTATGSSEMYQVMLRGIELTHAYNTACKRDHGTFADRAVDFQRVINSFGVIKADNPEQYAAVADFGVTWATEGFNDLLRGVLEEAKAYAVSCRVGAPITLEVLGEICLPLARYNRACRRLGLPASSGFLVHASRKAYQALARYAVTEKRAPWHPDRTSALDRETAELIRFCAAVKGVDTSGFAAEMKAFLNMVELNAPKVKHNVNVHQLILDWAAHNLP